MPVQYPTSVLPKTDLVPQIDPLRLLALKQSMEENQIQREKYARDLQEQDAKRYFDAIAAGVKAETAATTLQHLDTGSYNLGLELEKEHNKRKKEEMVSSPQFNAQVMGVSAGTLDDRAMPVPAPPNEALDRIMEGLPPELQDRVRLMQGAGAASTAATGSEIRAREASGNRQSSYSNALARETQRIGQERGFALGERASANQLTREGIAHIAAYGTSEQKEAVRKEIIQTLPPSEANLFLRNMETWGHGVRLKDMASQRSGAAAPKIVTRDAIIAWNQGDRSPETIATLLDDKKLVPNPMPPKGKETDPNYQYLWDGPGTDQVVKGLGQMSGVHELLDTITSLGRAAELAPTEHRYMSGLGGSQLMQDLRRGTASMPPIASAMGTALMEAQKKLAAIGNVGQITDFEQINAARMAPFMTEILDRNGKLSPAFIARTNMLHDIADRAAQAAAATDPTLRAQLKAEAEAELRRYTPAQRRALQAMNGALLSNSAEAIAGADKLMRSSGALDVSLQIEQERMAQYEARAKQEIEAYKARGPGAQQ